jgi:hypothetical protein
LRQRRLRRGGGLGFIQRALLHCGPFLLLIGLDLFARDWRERSWIRMFSIV